MADVKNIDPDLERLDTQLDKLEDALDPLLDNLNDQASQLPLLDKAKLFSLTAYSIESLLFSYLRLQGADAQAHPVYTELKRVQQYFGKIQATEDRDAGAAPERSLVVNQEAAARILKADLADNKMLSSKLAEKIAAERAKALLKSVEESRRRADAPASQGRAKKRLKAKGKGKER
ncbi:uncharacterized protein UV8b_04096 [Ustilaginoidea virens]|uniref:Exosome complex protein n=1 Tax=Ustilaginoidea virens TaxID=1159556 RepID=A0A8E5HQL3_USTVR|nr:uncharacterized protein UV8b_04096 [Ustilaginoidea virens]QUC19855.1 hypothetical protein UV8b_04096 [Ustilaginoidea virens]